MKDTHRARAIRIELASDNLTLLREIQLMAELLAIYQSIHEQG